MQVNGTKPALSGLRAGRRGSGPVGGPAALPSRLSTRGIVSRPCTASLAGRPAAVCDADSIASSVPLDSRRPTPPAVERIRHETGFDATRLPPARPAGWLVSGPGGNGQSNERRLLDVQCPREVDRTLLVTLVPATARTAPCFPFPVLVTGAICPKNGQLILNMVPMPF